MRIYYVHRPESKQSDVNSTGTLDVNGEEDHPLPVKLHGSPINLDEKPAKVDLYSQNVVQEDGNTDTVNRESIADLHSTRKQWETILQSSGKPESTPTKVTPKKSNTPVKHWEVKLPYTPSSSSKTIPEPENKDTQPRKPFKMEDDPYANESAIEREIRLANEREEMLRKEQEERLELTKRQNASKNQVNSKMFENENNNNTDFKAMYHEMTEADRGSELQKRESLIQQEIEEQKEREEALTTKPPPAVAPQNEESQDKSTESLIAKEIRLQKEREEELKKRHSLKEEPKSSAPESTETEPVLQEPKKMEAPVTNNKDVTYEEAIQEPFHHEGETLIARELREAKEREEEIRRMREKLQGGSKPSPVVEPSIKSPTQETVTKTKQPVPSVQSPKVSSQTPSRSVHVQPIADSTEEDETDYKPVERKETPIEREIRIARERENELRHQKGLPLLSEVVKPVQDTPTKSSVNEEPVSYNYRSKASTTEGKKSMRNFATSRLQNEILKQKEREHKLRDEGKILSTSEEHIGTMKYAEVAGIQKTEGPVKRNFVTRKSTSALPPAGDSPSSSNTPSENGDVEPPKMSSPQISKEEPVKYKRPAVKSGGASFSYKESRNQAESKIEKELREMREREEELKKARGGTMSPPTSPRDNNLSNRKAQFEKV